MYKFKTIIALVMLVAVSSTFTSCKSDHLDGIENVNNSAKFTIDGKTYNAEKGVSSFQGDIKYDAGVVKIHDFIESKTNVYFKLGTLLNENEIGSTLMFESTDNIALSEIVLPTVGDEAGKKYTSYSGSVTFISENKVELSGCKFYEFNSYEVDVQDSIFVDVEGTINYSSEADNITYCETKENDASSTWIESFRIDGAVDVINVSGFNDGYYDYSYYLYRLSQKKTWDLELTPGNSGTPSFVHWKIFVDSNNDGSFDDSEEVFATISASDAMVVSTIKVAQITEQGRYKMRVMMKVVSSSTDANDIKGCDNVGNGEVEDYTVNVVKYNS